MDGVSMITQCPILPFTSYHYRIVPEHTGTFYYHTHSGKKKKKKINFIRHVFFISPIKF